MMTDPNMVFSANPHHGLVARSDWEQEEARTVLRDLGWQWSEELHALVPPSDVQTVDAGVQAVQELHLHGHLTGYEAGRHGTLRLTLERAEQVRTRVAALHASSPHSGEQPAVTGRRPSAYEGKPAPEESFSPGPDAPEN